MNPGPIAISTFGPEEPPRRLFFAYALPRGLALFLGGFALINLLGDLRVARFDENLWWIDLRWLPGSIANPFLALASICLLTFGIRPPRSSVAARLVLGCACGLGIAALINAAAFFVLLARRNVSSSVSLPLSLMVALSLW